MGYLNYLKYVLLHKYFVLIAGFRLKVPFAQLILHDLSKLTKAEWSAYARCFYSKSGSKQYEPAAEFTAACNSHQKRNKHHFQYWVLIGDDGSVSPLPMPEKYVREMVADWMGAGRAITGTWEAKEWYLKNKDHMMLHPFTRAQAEMLLEVEDGER